jgi:TetR/AcrR family transcriptional regulator
MSAKVGLTVRLYRDRPHAAELLGAGHLITDLAEEFTTAMQNLVTGVLTDAGLPGPEGLAAVILALTRGPEADLTDLNLPYQRLRLGLDLLISGTRTPSRGLTHHQGE